MKRLLPLLLLVAVSVSAQQTAFRLPFGYTKARVAQKQGNRILVTYGRGDSTRYGYADPSGNVVIEAQYPHANVFFEGYASVAEGPLPYHKKGIIDTLGRYITPICWEHVGKVSEGRFWVCEIKDGKKVYLYRNLQDKPLFGRSFDHAGDFSQGVAVFGVGESKQQEVPEGFNPPQGFDPRQMAWNFKGLYGMIDSTGREIVPPIYKIILPLKEGLAATATAGKYYDKWGFLNTKGEEVIPFDYYSVEDFHNGRAVVCKVIDGELKYGQVDTAGNICLAIKWDYVSTFRFGSLWVGEGQLSDTRFMLLDAQGRNLLSQWVYDVNNSSALGLVSCAIVSGTGLMRYGVVSSAGKVVIPFEYDQIMLYSEWDHHSGNYVERGIAYKNNESIPFTLSK